MNTKLQWSHGRLLHSAENFTKQKKNNKYFWVFEFLKQEQKKQATKQNVFGFFEMQLK